MYCFSKKKPSRRVDMKHGRSSTSPECIAKVFFSVTACTWSLQQLITMLCLCVRKPLSETEKWQESMINNVWMINICLKTKQTSKKKKRSSNFSLNKAPFVNRSSSVFYALEMEDSVLCDCVMCEHVWGREKKTKVCVCVCLKNREWEEMVFCGMFLFHTDTCSLWGRSVCVYVCVSLLLCRIPHLLSATGRLKRTSNQIWQLFLSIRLQVKLFPFHWSKHSPAVWRG